MQNKVEQKTIKKMKTMGQGQTIRKKKAEWKSDDQDSFMTDSQSDHDSEEFKG